MNRWKDDTVTPDKLDPLMEIFASLVRLDAEIGCRDVGRLEQIRAELVNLQDEAKSLGVVADRNLEDALKELELNHHA